MAIFQQRPEPNSVFTPRARDINDRMYVDRPDLEQCLVDALKGDKYIVIHGESGNGKTWLYKRVLAREDVYYYVVNLANANLHGSLLGAFKTTLGDLGFSYNREGISETEGAIKVAGSGVSQKQQDKYHFEERSAFANLVSKIRSLAGKRAAVLVLDNFEQIVDNNDLLRSVASLIISADEDTIASQRVKLLIVGVPNNLREMVAKVGNANTIANRLVEIPEVARMTQDQANSVMFKGFEEQLKYKFELDRVELYREACWKTDRIAQQIHEVCLKIALEAQRNGDRVSSAVVQKAEGKWLEESFSSDFSVIELAMNSIETKVGRKNQVIYCLGKCDREDFRHSDIERIVREEFDVDDKVNLGLPQMLAGFSKLDNPLLRKQPKSNSYRFASPKLRMAIRTGLRRVGDKIIKYKETEL
jgi:AAA domain